MLFLTSWPKSVCVCSSELLSRWLLQSNSRSISLVPWKRFLSLCFSEPVLENVVYVKPLAEHDTASTGPFLQHTHILSFLWLHHCQSLQMEKGSQIPLLVKSGKCSSNIFLSFSVYPQLPETVSSVCATAKGTALSVRARKCTLISQTNAWHLKGQALSGFPSCPDCPPVMGTVSCCHCTIAGASPQTLPLQIVKDKADTKNSRWKKQPQLTGSCKNSNPKLTNFCFWLS